MNLGTVNVFVQHSHTRLSATLLSLKQDGFFGVLEECAFLTQTYLQGALAMLDPNDAHENTLIARITSISNEVEQLRQRRRFLVGRAVELGLLSKTKNQYTIVRVP